MERNYRQDYLSGVDTRILNSNFQELANLGFYSNLLYTNGTHIKSILRRDMFRESPHSYLLNQAKSIIHDIKFDILKKPILTINHKKDITFTLGVIYLSAYHYRLISITYDDVKRILKNYDNKIDVFRSIMSTNFIISNGNNELGLTHSLIVYKDFFTYSDLIYDMLINIRDNVDETILKSICSGLEVEQKIVNIINEKSPYRIVGDHTSIKTQHLLDTKDLVELFSNHTYKIGDLAKM